MLGDGAERLPGRSSTPPMSAPWSKLAREQGVDLVMNAADPRFVPTLFDAAFEAGVDYMDMAVSLSEPHPDGPVPQARRAARRLPVPAARRVGDRGPPGAPGHGHGPRPDRRLRQVRRQAPLRRDRRGPRPRRRRPAHRGLRVRAGVQHLDHHRGVPQPAAHLGEGPRLLHHRAVLGARVVRLPGGHRPGRVRQRGARGGRAGAARRGRQEGHLQVRPRRRVHRGPQDAPQARPRLDQADPRQGRRRGAARRGRGRAPRIRRASASA